MNTEKVTAILVAGWFGLVAAAQTVETVVPKAEDLSEPYGVAVDLATNVYYFSDSANHRILRFDPVNKDLLVIAGSEAGLFSPHALAMSPGGLIVADSGSHVIRRIGLNGNSSILAGRPGEWGNVDGAAGSARFHAPSGVAYAPDGSVIVADSKNSALRRIAPDGQVSTLASGFFEPAAVAVAPDGRIFVADTRNHVVKLVTAEGNVTVIAGATGVMGSRDGAAGGAQFNRPRGLFWVGGDTGLLVADSGNNTIRRVSERGGFWRVDTFAGSAESAALVDGDLKVARFFSPVGLAVDAEGAVVVADLYNNALRRINRKVPPSPVILPAGGSFSNTLTLAITSAVPSTVFRFTTNGLPVSPFSAITGELLTLSGGPVPLQVRGYSTDWATSPNVSNYFTFFVNPVSASIPGGTYSNAVDLSFHTETEGVVFRYSTNSLPPTTNSLMWRDRVYETSGPLQVQAFRDGFAPSAVVSNVYQFVVAAPSIDPPGANEKNPVTVRLASETVGASIYWTLDNTEPSPSNGILYRGPFLVSSNGLLKVRAYRDNFAPSPLVGANFNFTVDDPAVSPPGATANRPVTIELSSLTEAARLYWTINGGDPTTSDQLYTGPFVLSTNGVLRVRGFRDGFNPSITISNTYNLAVSPLSINLPGGNFNNDVFLSVVSPTTEARLHYVTAANEVPSAFSPRWTNQVISSTRTIQIQGFLDGLVPSPVLSNRFEFQVAPLKIPVTGGTFENTLEIPIATLTSNVQFRYTLNGVAPDHQSPILPTSPASGGNGTEALYPLQANSLGDRTVLQVQGYRDGYAATTVYSNQFILKADAPSIQAGVRASNGPVQVAMTTGTTNAQIYWAVGRPPTQADNLYAGPFTHRTNGLLQARSFREGFLPSEVTSEAFDLAVSSLTTAERVRSTSIVGSTPGLYYDTIELRVASASEGVRFHYTTDGFTLPSPTTSVIPSRPSELERGESSAGVLTLSGNDSSVSNRFLPLRLQGFLDGLRPTPLVSSIYRFDVGPLKVVRGNSGIYHNPVEIRISTVTTNTRLHYTLSDPSADAALIADGYVIDRTPTPQSPLMVATGVRGEEGSAGLITLSSNTASGSVLLRVSGFRDTFNPSSVVAEEYRFVTAKPTIAASATVSNGPVRVTLASETTDARIYWAVNREPTTNDSLYTGPFSHTANGVLQARAFREGFTPSEIASQAFDLEVSALSMTERVRRAAIVGSTPGLYYDAIEVRVASASEGVRFHYTTDGFTPPSPGTPVIPLRPDEVGRGEASAGILALSGNDNALSQKSLSLRVQGFFENLRPTTPVGGEYRFDVGPLRTVRGIAGTYHNPVEIRISTVTTNAQFHYTLADPAADAALIADGYVIDRTPTPQDAAMTPTSVRGEEASAALLTLSSNTPSGSVLLRVAGYRSAFNPSAVVAHEYRFVTATPTIAVSAASGSAPVRVILATETVDARIYWAVDREPGTNDSLYTGPFDHTANGLLQVRAFRTGFHPSAVASQNIELRVATPELTPQGISTNDAVRVTIASATPGADIRWTIDGETPTLERGQRYVEPFLLATNGLLQARAFFASFEPSGVAGAPFVLQVSDPVAAPNATRAINSLMVTLSAGKPSDTVRFTRDGSTPSADAEIYSVPITLRTNTVLTVQGVRSGFLSSQVRSYEYRIQVDTPRLTPPSGYFPDGTTVTLEVERADAEIRYTLDGSDPTTNSLRYSGPFKISQLDAQFPELRLVKARAFAPGTDPSEVATGQYAQTNAIGFARDAQYRAGVGSTVVLPVVVMLETNVTVRSLQFRVEVTPETPGAPNLTGDLLPLAISSDDFVPLKVPAASGGTGRGPSLMSAASYKLPAQPAPGDIVTNGLVITALGTNANLEMREFDTVTLVAIPIPRGAQVGQVYRVGVVAPSATSDGRQATVALQAMAPHRIIVTNVSYLVGDAAPGRWYNAGDFGDGSVDNADVNLAMSASLGIGAPFAFTDVHDALDAYPPDADGVAGGDGEIRFLDWQLILRRSLGLDTNRWYRSWGPDGMRRTQTGTGAFRTSTASPASVWNVSDGWTRSASVGAASLGRVKPGQTARVPVYVKLAQGNVLKGLQFRARVTPSAKSKGVAARFVQAAGMPEPLAISRLAAGEVAGAWALDVNSFSPALTSSNVVGYVEFEVPESALTGEHFVVQFFGVDGAPDGGTQYEFETVSGFVWVGEEVPEGLGIVSEEWMAAYFGGGVAEVQGRDDADGDGAVNWQEYLAGSDPTNPASALELKVSAVGIHGNTVVLRWDTALGKRYQLECTTDPGVGPWRGLGGVLEGTGARLEVQDAVPASGKSFYRLRLIP